MLRDVYQFVTWRQKSFPDFILFYLLFIPHNDKGLIENIEKVQIKWILFEREVRWILLCVRFIMGFHLFLEKILPDLCSPVAFIVSTNYFRKIYICFLKYQKFALRMGYKSPGSREFFLINLFVPPKFCTYVGLDFTINKNTNPLVS